MSEKYFNMDLAYRLVKRYDDTYCWTSLYSLEGEVADKYGIDREEVHSIVTCLICAARDCKPHEEIKKARKNDIKDRFKIIDLGVKDV